MSDSVAIPESLAELTALVKAGELRDAKRLTRKLLNRADTHDLTVIAQCGHMLETWPRTAVTHLRDYWRRSTEHDRAIIAACVPEPGEPCHRREPQPARAPRWTRTNTYQAPRDLRTEVRPEARRHQKPNQRQDIATVTAYDAERAGVDDQPPRAEPAPGYHLDYDRAAVPDVRGTPCVRCWLERASTDLATARVRAGHGDDGLCASCRDAHRPGIPELPTEHTRADAITARCAFIAAHVPTAAVKILRNEWKRATGADRDVIAAWVAAHLTGQTGDTTEPTATESAPTDTDTPATCGQCGLDPNTVDRAETISLVDGLCEQCRDLNDYMRQPAEDSADDSADDAEPAPLVA